MIEFWEILIIRRDAEIREREGGNEDPSFFSNVVVELKLALFIIMAFEGAHGFTRSWLCARRD